jgi:hypothetical protein
MCERQPRDSQVGPHSVRDYVEEIRNEGHEVMYVAP